MGNMTIRNLPDDIHEGLKFFARNNQRSAEAEARHIITTAISGRMGEGLGDLMRHKWVGVTGDDLQIPPRTDGPREVSFE